MARRTAAHEPLIPVPKALRKAFDDFDLALAAAMDVYERFVAAWAYARLLPTLAEKFSHIEDPETAKERYCDDDIRRYALHG